MKTTLHMAISKDGYIAKSDGDSDWVSKIDEDLFKERVQKAGCVVIGKTTFDQYHGVIYPIEGAINIVLSHEPILAAEENVVYTSSPAEALKIAEEKGCAGVLVSGGAKTAAAFLAAGLLDEVFITEHPLILGDGIKLFEGVDMENEFNLIGTKDLGEGLTERHYSVN